MRTHPVMCDVSGHCLKQRSLGVAPVLSHRAVEAHEDILREFGCFFWRGSESLDEESDETRIEARVQRTELRVTARPGTTVVPRRTRRPRRWHRGNGHPCIGIMCISDELPFEIRWGDFLSPTHVYASQPVMTLMIPLRFS